MGVDSRREVRHDPDVQTRLSDKPVTMYTSYLGRSTILDPSA